MSDSADNKIKHPLSLEEATRIINCYASSKDVTRDYRLHALERMEERMVHSEWVDTVLKNGKVISSKQNKYGRWSYNVAFTDKYGLTRVITAIPGINRLSIITVIRDD